ncbi:hypothetical protein K8352_19030 [Flavobacteriaceae bacterium F89]|uniref:Uncharacterized protein n=1 Tax=Cerina litoralis TaxID=2874477 RepID=A0AAE3EYK0_9FLAO|nr:hypothetical protein [Cerina litoralis]MCG2462865.1 hypothetical protein [Cerina litoralis]
MAQEKMQVIKEADLTNNCPECFNQELKLTFSQKHKFGRLYHRTTDEVVSEIKCKKCGSTIYPVNWTEDIERVYDYYQKMVGKPQGSLRFTTLFYVIILLLIISVAIGAYFLIQKGRG